MPLLCGPLNSRFTFTGTPCPHLDLALHSNAKNLVEALIDYEQHFKVTIKPMLEPLDDNPANTGKYFKYWADDSETWSAVDIHILRADEEICPKQDLLFQLHPSDIVEIGQLIC